MCFFSLPDRTRTKEIINYKTERGMILGSEEKPSSPTNTVSTQRESKIKINYRKTFQGICGKMLLCDTLSYFVKNIANFLYKFISGFVGGKEKKFWKTCGIIPSMLTVKTFKINFHWQVKIASYGGRKGKIGQVFFTRLYLVV